MPGFEEGKDKTIIQQAPDLKKLQDDYNRKVIIFENDLKKRTDALNDISARLISARADLQIQYSAKIMSKETQLADLTSQIAALKDTISSLSAEISDKKIQKNAISLDFAAERQRLDASWDEFHMAFTDYQAKQKEVNYAQDSLLRANAELETAKKSFVDYKAAALADIDQKVAAANDLIAEAKSRDADSMSVLKRVSDALTDLAQKKEAMETALTKAGPIIAQSDIIQEQASFNKKVQAENDAIALQNQTDVNQIKVLKIALHNKEMELNAREQAVSQAEQKIGG